MGTIADFKAKLTGGGARPNQFRVRLTFPSVIADGLQSAEKAQFLCKAASLPASTIENIELFYRGKATNVAGESSFEPWNVTIYNDTDFGIRDSFEQWHHYITKYNATCGATNPIDYQVDMEVDQLGRCDEVLKTYKFVDVYPTRVGEIELSFDSKEIETFAVTLQYNYFIPSNVINK